MGPQKTTDKILDVDVHNTGIEKILDQLEEWIDLRDNGRTLFCANPHSLAIAGRDKEFLNSLQAADILIPDGIGIVLASTILRGEIKQRITGMDILEEFAKRLNERHRAYSFFFLGSRPEVLRRIETQMAMRYPNIRIAGLLSPPFKPEFSLEESNQIVQSINNSSPSVLWVGMTAPKQEKWIHQNKQHLNVPVICAIGAAFDFFAGTKKRSPKLFRDIGLEWLPRLMREPNRLWRRTVVSAPIFFWQVFMSRLIR